MNKKNALMLFAGILPVVAAAQERPNIIYIMCDDMGYGDLGCYGQQLISTPNLDRMAAEGMRFTQAYAGSPVSAPSRACFMTGQHTGHVHVRGNREYWQSARQENMFGSNPDYQIIGQEPYKNTHKIVPELFKEAGYRTGMFGKWAGGYYNMNYPDTYKVDAEGNTITSASSTSSSASLPNKRGIDCYYGPICQFQAHTYYPNFLNRYDPEKYGDKHIVVDTLKQNIQHRDVSSGNADYENREQYTADLIHQYALDWIDRQEAGKPFLGIFTYTLPHAELWQPNDSILQKYIQAFECDDSGFGGAFGSWYYKNSNRHAQFAAMITRLDTQVGEIFEKLEEKGLADNTLVIFTSDNGPHEEGGADPDWFNRDGLLRGTKRSTHEGGIRVPFIVSWGDRLTPEVSEHIGFFPDVMPTLCDIAEVRCPETDGISFLPTLTGKEQKEHEYLYWEFPPFKSDKGWLCVRMGEWKGLVTDVATGNNTMKLYRINEDPREENDLAAEYPEVVKEMWKHIRSSHTPSDHKLFNLEITFPEN